MNRSKRNRIFIFVGAFLGLVMIYLLFFYSPEQRFNWREDYKLDRERPHGTWLIAELLQHYEPQRPFKNLNQPLDQSLSPSKTPSNYVFIGQDMFLQPSFVDTLLNYVSKGNNALIFTEGMPIQLLEYFLDHSEAIDNPDAPQEEGRSDELENETSGFSDEEEIILDSAAQLVFEEPWDSLEPNGEYDGYDIDELEYVDDYNYLGYYGSFYDDSLKVRTTANAFEDTTWTPYRFHGRFGITATNWYYVLEEDLLKVGAESLGQTYSKNRFDQEGIKQTNFFKIKHGEGYFYFHTQPQLFCNIQLLDSGALAYSNKVFAYLNSGPVYWEEHNWIFNRPSDKTWVYLPGYGRQGESPLKLILSEPGLRWGWYLLLTFTLLFIAFEGKRKQKVIPVLADKQNTTLGHIKALTKLYYKNDEHYPIAVKMHDNFMWFLRAELQVDTTQSESKIIEQVHQKSGFDFDKIESIFSLWTKINCWKSVKSSVFMDFYQRITQFYAHVGN